MPGNIIAFGDEEDKKRLAEHILKLDLYPLLMAAADKQDLAKRPLDHTILRPLDQGKLRKPLFPTYIINNIEKEAKEIFQKERDLTYGVNPYFLNRHLEKKQFNTTPPLFQGLNHYFNPEHIKEKPLTLLNEIGGNFNLEQIITPTQLIPAEEMLQQHQFYINALNNFFKEIRNVKLEETENPELSAEYAERIKAMPKTISAEEIALVTRMLRLGPLLTGALSLGSVLSDPGKNPSRQTMDKVQQLVECYKNTTSGLTAISLLMQADTSGVSVKIHDPFNDTTADLNQMLIDGNACTKIMINTTGLEDSLDNTPADLFAKDSKKGGSVHFTAKTEKGTSYNRLYIAIDKDNKPVLFYDCIESGDMMWRTIEHYLINGCGDRLLSSFVSSIIIANRLGISKVALGEDEAISIGKALGFGEQKIFGDGDNHKSKLGYVAGKTHTEGPYAWRMGNDKTFKAFDPRLYNPEIIMQMIAQSYAVMQRVEERPKIITSRKSNTAKDFKEYLKTYFRIVEQVLDAAGIDDIELRDSIDNFCKKYEIRQTPIISPALSHPQNHIPYQQRSAL